MFKFDIKVNFINYKHEIKNPLKVLQNEIK